jgi:hypothetical protein
VIERKLTMASAPIVSNLPWPYGCSASGGSAAKRMASRATRLFRASTPEWPASPRIAMEPERRPTASLAMMTRTLAARTHQRTRRTCSLLPSVQVPGWVV